MLPPGRWVVRPDASSVTFRATGLFGLAPANGRFTAFRGDLDVAEDGTSCGELTIEPRSIETGLRLRDRHLRARGFFDVERHPLMVFGLRSATRAGLHGDLHIVGRAIVLEVEVDVEPGPVIVGRASLDHHAEGGVFRHGRLVSGRTQIDARLALGAAA